MIVRKSFVGVESNHYGIETPAKPTSRSRQHALNRTTMELKLGHRDSMVFAFGSLNRTTMELKPEMFPLGDLTAKPLNRTTMELKQERRITERVDSRPR